MIPFHPLLPMHAPVQLHTPAHAPGVASRSQADEEMELQAALAASLLEYQSSPTLAAAQPPSTAPSAAPSAAPATVSAAPYAQASASASPAVPAAAGAGALAPLSALPAEDSFDLDAILTETLSSPSTASAPSAPSPASALEQYLASSTLQPEPSESEPDHFAVKFKFSDGSTFVRRFAPSDTIGALVLAAVQHDSARPSPARLVSFPAGAPMPLPRVRLRCAGVPAEELADWALPLSASALPKRALLSVEV